MDLLDLSLEQFPLMYLDQCPTEDVASPEQPRISASVAEIATAAIK